MQDELYNIRVSGTTISVSPDKDRVIIGGKEGVSMWKLPVLQPSTDPTSQQQQQQQQSQSQSQSPQPLINLLQSPGIHGATPASAKTASAGIGCSAGLPRGNQMYPQTYNSALSMALKGEQSTPKQSSASEIRTKKMQPIMSLAWNPRISKQLQVHS